MAMKLVNGQLVLAKPVYLTDAELKLIQEKTQALKKIYDLMEKGGKTSVTLNAIRKILKQSQDFEKKVLKKLEKKDE